MKKKPERTWELVVGFELRKGINSDFWAVYEGGKQISGQLQLPGARIYAQELRKSRNEANT